MNGLSRWLPRRWMLLAGTVMLIAAHAMVLRYALPHRRFSGTVLAGVMILVVIKHLGLLSPLYALFRPRPRR